MTDLSAHVPGARPASNSAAGPSPRRAGPPQGAVLLAASCLPVLGAVLLAPGLPAMTRAFAGTPGAEVLVPLVLTAPSLLLGLSAPLAGRLADRVGRRSLLVVSLVAYAVLGTAPLFLGSLVSILASRVLVGLAEAGVMTCCTTLLADYYSGRRRQRMLGLQGVTITLAATVFLSLGGALVDQSWRAPFWLYAISLPLAVAAALLLWDPVSESVPSRELPGLPWRRFIRPIAVSFVGGILFYVLVIELSFKLDTLGVTSAAVIGLITGGSTLTTAVTSGAFGPLSRLGLRVLVPAAFLFLGVAYVGLGLAPSVFVAVIAALVGGLGCGLLLPSLLSWALDGLELAQRGRGTGSFWSALFLGEFLCPLAMLALAGAFGGLEAALVAAGCLALLMAVLGRVLAPARGR